MSGDVTRYVTFAALLATSVGGCVAFNWDYYAYSNRMDWQISDKWRAFGRWSINNFGPEDRGDWTYESARGLNVGGLSLWRHGRRRPKSDRPRVTGSPGAGRALPRAWFPLQSKSRPDRCSRGGGTRPRVRRRH